MQCHHGYLVVGLQKSGRGFEAKVLKKKTDTTAAGNRLFLYLSLSLYIFIYSNCISLWFWLITHLWHDSDSSYKEPCCGTNQGFMRWHWWLFNTARNNDMCIASFRNIPAVLWVSLSNLFHDNDIHLFLQNCLHHQFWTFDSFFNLESNPGQLFTLANLGGGGIDVSQNVSTFCSWVGSINQQLVGHKLENKAYPKKSQQKNRFSFSINLGQ